MKKYALIAPMIVPMIFSAAPAFAEKPYVGVDYFIASYDQINADLNSQGVRIKTGSEITPYFAIEVFIASTVENTLNRTNGQEIDASLESIVGASVRLQYPVVQDRVGLYTTLGVSRAVIVAKSELLLDEEISAAESGTSLGFGVDVAVSKQWLVNLDYTSYVNRGAVELNAASIGIKYRLD
ncbi:MAG: hypothetical protein COB04_07195 [Gammaproteobacteria bacterium]|nr:MAG: hypothetical protein COB04_07195 [Gammaproteobacteria bacterium]